MAENPTTRNNTVPVHKFIAGLLPHQVDILKVFDTEEKRFFLLCHHRRARKTTLMLNLLIREAIKHPASMYGYIAPTYKQGKAIAWLDPNMLMAYLPMAYVKDINQSELYVRFKNKSMLTIRGADEPDSIKGVDYRGVGLDEFALQKLAVWQEILRPIIAQSKDRWAMFTFTPKGRNHAFDYWNLADRPDMQAEWFKSFLPASRSGIIPDAELVKMRLEISQATYQQELECDFLENLAGVFKNQYLELCSFGEVIEDELYMVAPEAGATYVLGVDLAKYMDYTVLIILNSKTGELVYFNRFNETSWRLQKERIKEVARQYNDALIVPDSTGVGDPIVEDLQHDGCNVYCDLKNPERPGFVFNNRSKEQLIEALVIAIEHQKVKFPRIAVLLSELRNFEMERLPSGNVRYSAPEGKHDDCVAALALAVKGLGQDGTLVWSM